MFKVVVALFVGSVAVSGAYANEAARILSCTGAPYSDLRTIEITSYRTANYKEVGLKGSCTLTTYDYKGFITFTESRPCADFEKLLTPIQSQDDVSGWTDFPDAPGVVRLPENGVYRALVMETAKNFAVYKRDICDGSPSAYALSCVFSPEFLQ